MKEQGNNEEDNKDERQAAGGNRPGPQEPPAGEGVRATSDRQGKGAATDWDGVNDGIDRAEADVSQMMDDLEYIRAKVRVLRGRYG